MENLLPTSPTRYEFSGFRLDAEEGLLERPDGELVVLSPKLLQLLVLFLDSDGRVLTRDELMARLWPDSVVEPASLKQLIYSLRKALGEGEQTEEMIKNLPRRGYRFLVEPVRENGSRSAAAEISMTSIVVEREEEIEYSDDELDKEPSPEKMLGSGDNSRSIRYFIPILLAGVVLLAVLGGYFWFTRGSASTLTSENISLQKLTHTDNLYWALISPNGQFVAYIALHRDGSQSLELLDVTTRTERTIIPPANVSYYGGSFTPDSSQLYYDTWDHTDLTGNCVLYQVPVLGDKPRKVLDKVAGPVSFSPDGKRFAFTRHGPAPDIAMLVTANATDGSDEKIIASSPVEDDFIAPSWAPDGHGILFVFSEKTPDGVKWSAGEVSLDGQRRVVAGPLKQRFWGALWLGDGKTILLSASAPDSKIGQLFTVAYPSGEIKRLTNDLNYYSGLSATADGKKIVVSQGLRTNDIWVSPLNNPKPAKVTGGSFVIDALTWSPDNRILYNISENGQHRLTSILADGSNKTSILPDGIQGLEADISTDGKSMVFMSNRSGKWQIYVSAVDGSGMRQLTGEDEIVAVPRFVLDGRSIIFQRMADERQVLTLVNIDGTGRRDFGRPYVGDWAVSNDLKTVAYSYTDLDKNKTQTAVQPLEADVPTKLFDLLPRDILLFAPKDDALLTKRFEADADPLSNIWSYPIAGGPPTLFYSNPPDNIYAAAFSDDLSKIAVVQGRSIANLVLFTRSR